MQPITRTSRFRHVLRWSVPLAALLAIGGQFFLANRSGTVWSSLVPGLILYLVAITLLLAGLAKRRGERDAEAPDLPPWLPGHLKPELEWSLVALIVLAGLFLRVHDIDVIPRGLNNDEAINAIEAEEISGGKGFATITERGLNRETMFHYLAALSYRHPQLGLNLLRAMPAVFGLEPKLINDPMMDLLFPLRAVSIAVGTLTLLALYLFARRRFGWHVGMLAMLFLAVSPWHLLYSRAGLRTILAPLFGIVAVALFLRARDSGRTVDHLAWGAVVGLGLWTYTSFRAIPIALLAFLLLRMLGRRGEGIATRAVPSIFYGAGVSAGIGGLLWFLSGLTLRDFLFRGAYATLPPLSNWGLNLFHSLTMANYYPSRYAVIQSDEFISDGVSTTFGAIGLEPEAVVTAALATIGLIYAAWRGFGRPRHDGSALIVVCALALLLTVGWTGPSLSRMLLNLPWLCLFAALMAWRAVSDLATLRRPLGVWLGVAAVAGVAVLAPAQGYSNYFIRAGGSERAMEHFGATQTVMGMYARSLPEGLVLYLLHTRRVDTLRYLLGDRPDVHLLTDPSTVDIDALAQNPRSVVFVVEHVRRFAEPLQYLINRFQLLNSTASFGDGRFPDRRCARVGEGAALQVDDPCRSDTECGPGGECDDRTIFWRSAIWKDETGQPIPPPGAMPDAPGGMSFPAPPGAVPPGS